MSSPSREPASHRRASAAELFQRLWDEVADLVGSAATAALLRRALKRAAEKQPELAAVVLRREGLGYAWVLPGAWHDPARREAVEQLRRLVREDLHPSFRELAGLVIARRLARAPELVEAGPAARRQGDGAHAVTPPPTASVLADLAHALEAGQDAEARVRRALAALRRLVPHDRCALVNATAAAAPRLLLEPPLPEPERRRLETRAEALLASLFDHAPGALPPIPAGPASHLAVPLVALDALAGVLLVERDDAAYGEQDLQLLSVVASLLGAYLASLRLHDEERRVAQELRDAIGRRTHFLSMLSHELRNPLGSIGNALHLLDRVAPGSERAASARAIMGRQFGHLTRLVNDLLDATRLASGKVQVRRARMDLAEVVCRTVDDHRSLFVRGGAGLDLRVADGPLWVDGDAVRLAQVIGNLLSNAAKFAGPDGKTEVSVAREEPGIAVVRVRDDGVGIAPEVRSRLFEPFAQGADTLDRNRAGLGLGLALAKGLVDLHGGTIAARGDDGSRGTELVVTLPLLPETHAAAAPASGEKADRATAP
ncbi:GAF sensor signal transduction histidine kinase [Anaeromyxobacter dehalogenans 2CP-1]|uniref:histidine kinase n=1 Tax=Anaeromyxobacter dehalogenans (strain ATCC BAA-258 / DSM 21875 / 2CP-1) TaxID=455488 RepID=B8JHJ7_ANAD2|nr:HAMP domain-containing sensor histidine kinase [Anaeromyxobacter dehalogenans]ACL66709.1 GAF sensor signal transduction histidine kinase [Anaeromyxobacter dehalogenans 2CP-1]